MRFARASIVVARAVQAERRLTTGNTFRLVALGTIFLVVIAGAVQAEANAGEFKSLWDGIWWAIVTVTTVGYGDIYPTTVSGRLIGMALMFLGIGFLAVLTATISSRFIKSERADETAAILAALARLEADVAELKTRRAD
jgi:voltage-gated potassium channel